MDDATPGGRKHNRALQALGLAFAAGDLLLELDGEGNIAACLGASQELTGLEDAALTGADYLTIFAEADHAALAEMLDTLQPGRRCGPLSLKLKRNGTRVRFSACMLPQLAPNISCALNLERAPAASGSGLMSGEAFAADAMGLLASARAAGVELNLDLVELEGLAATLAKLEPGAAQTRRSELAAALTADAYAGSGAAEVAVDRYAVLRSADDDVDALAARLRAMPGLHLAPTSARLSLAGETPEQNVRALRYALDRYIEDGAMAAHRGFDVTMRKTLAASAKFRAIVADGAFHLAYQPIVNLETGQTHHYEALARFDADGSPADTIKLAEELDMIQDLDATVFRMVAKELRAADPEVKIAVNISARSLQLPGFVDKLLEMAGERELRVRMLIEVTESAALGDLNAANEIIQDMRRAGHVVGLDDFGAGAASLEYIRDLHVDFLKIDGRYVRDLVAGDRGGVLLKHLVALCRDLDVWTIAEMIETPETAKAIRQLGVDFGQGFLFGRPRTVPEPSIADLLVGAA